MIALVGIHRLDLLRRLYARVCLPAQVHAELTASARFAVQNDVFAQPWLEVVSLPDPLDPLLVSQLDIGEAAVLTLAKQIPFAEVLMDERRGRRVAERAFGLPILGTGGLLLRAKAARLITAVKPLLHEMVHNGYYLGEQLIQAVCSAAAE